MPEVRLIGPNGEQVGVVAIDQAIRMAEEVGLDLVEIAPDAQPPVCKVMISESTSTKSPRKRGWLERTKRTWWSKR